MTSISNFDKVVVIGGNMKRTQFSETEIVEIIKKYYDIREPVQWEFSIEDISHALGPGEFRLTLHLSTEVDKT